jgi:hypothetical protein
MFAGIILAMPVYRSIRKFIAEFSEGHALKTACLITLPGIITLSSLLLFSIFKIAASTYNPFIYFRF